MQRDAVVPQTVEQQAAESRKLPNPSALLRWSVLLASFAGCPITKAQDLPNSPGALLTQRLRIDDPQTPAGTATTPPSAQPGTAANASAKPAAAARLPPCEIKSQTSAPGKNSSGTNPSAELSAQIQAPCRKENPVQPIVTSRQIKPLTVQEKGDLAVRDTIGPFNLLTIGGYSAIAVAINPRSAYGPGLKGWGRLSGYSLVEDAQGEFFGTFLIASVTHEDPRYHRMPNAPLKRRVFHALAHTWVSQHDDGTPMPNYSTLLTYPISAELSNLYVPGVPTDLPSTARRVGIGLATDPTGTLVAEFLPDIAKHLHIHVIFIQEILNKVATGGTAPNAQ